MTGTVTGGATAARGRTRVGVFIAYATCGLLAAVGLAAAFTPLILLLVLAGAGVTLLALRVRSPGAVFGLLSGAGLVPLWIAWLDRGWIWLASGLTLVLGGIALAVRRTTTAPAPEGQAPSA